MTLAQAGTRQHVPPLVAGYEMTRSPIDATLQQGNFASRQDLVLYEFQM